MLVGVTSDRKFQEGPFRRLACVAVAAIILMMPAALNRSPFLFYDTSHYLEFGRSISQRLPLFRVLTNDRAPISSSSSEKVVPLVPANDTHGDKEREHPSLSYAGGRSPYYSFFIYVLTKVGGLWLVASLQAILAAALLWIACELVAPSFSIFQFMLLTAGLSVLSSLGFYVDMIMPDVFAGLALLASGLLIFGFDRLPAVARIGLVAVIAGAAAAHATIPVVCFAGLLTVMGSIIFFGGKRLIVKRRSIAVWTMAGPVFAIFGSMLFSTVTKIALGDTPQSPPYLMARILADGTGRSYLHESCRTSASYFLCSFENRKFNDQNQFLWSDDPTIGVFSVSDYEARRKLKAEELSFVLGTITKYPLWQARVSAAHWARQLLSIGLSEFRDAAPSWDRMAFNLLIPEEEPLYKSGLAYRGLFPFGFFDWLQVTTVIASIGWLIFRLTGTDIREVLRRTRRDGASVELFLVSSALGLFGGLSVNAAICGVFSGVNDRYQARLIWLVPMLAMLALCRLGVTSSRRSRQSGPPVTAAPSMGDNPFGQADPIARRYDPIEKATRG